MQCCVKKQNILTKSNVEKLFSIIDRKGAGKIGTLLMHQCLGGTLEKSQRVGVIITDQAIIRDVCKRSLILQHCYKGF
jgi:hypothetical protein